MYSSTHNWELSATHRNPSREWWNIYSKNDHSVSFEIFYYTILKQKCDKCAALRSGFIYNDEEGLTFHSYEYT